MKSGKLMLIIGCVENLQFYECMKRSEANRIYIGSVKIYSSI